MGDTLGRRSFSESCICLSMTSVQNIRQRNVIFTRMYLRCRRGRLFRAIVWLQERYCRTRVRTAVRELYCMTHWLARSRTWANEMSNAPAGFRSQSSRSFIFFDWLIIDFSEKFWWSLGRLTIAKVDHLLRDDRKYLNRLSLAGLGRISHSIIAGVCYISKAPKNPVVRQAR